MAHKIEAPYRNHKTLTDSNHPSLCAFTKGTSVQNFNSIAQCLLKLFKMTPPRSEKKGKQRQQEQEQERNEKRRSVVRAPLGEFFIFLWKLLSNTTLWRWFRISQPFFHQTFISPWKSGSKVHFLSTAQGFNVPWLTQGAPNSKMDHVYPHYILYALHAGTSQFFTRRLFIPQNQKFYPIIYNRCYRIYHDVSCALHN